MLRKDHPIRYAWDNHARRRAQYHDLLVGNDNPFTLVHCTSRADVAAALRQLTSGSLARDLSQQVHTTGMPSPGHTG